MISHAAVERVRSLLAEGRLSKRRIAAVTGISRATIAAIARGRNDELAGRRLIRDLRSGDEEGTPQRCPGCGGMVFMPCRLCRVRQHLWRRRVRQLVER